MKFLKKKKAQAGNIASILVGGGAILVVATLLLAFASDVVEDVDNDFTGNASAIAEKGKESLFNTSKQTPNIGTLLGVVVILGLVIGVAAVARYRS